jgi:hypothetical protein
MRLESRISNFGQLLKAQDASPRSSGTLPHAESPPEPTITTDLVYRVDELLEMSNFDEM